MKMMRLLLAVSLLRSAPRHSRFRAVTRAPQLGLAPTPPMGWNSWNKFGCNVSEDMIKEMADAVVKSGMKDAGYHLRHTSTIAGK